MDSVLATVLGISVLTNRFVELAIKPIFERFSLDKFWLTYIAWVFAGILVWFTGANVFPFFISPMVGQVLTAVFAGGGANLLADYMPKNKEAAK